MPFSSAVPPYSQSPYFPPYSQSPYFPPYSQSPYFPSPLHRQVTVDRPDVSGRIEILKVHSKGKSLGKDVDLDKIARRTPGFTGQLSLVTLFLFAALHL